MFTTYSTFKCLLIKKNLEKGKKEFIMYEQNKNVKKILNETM